MKLSITGASGFVGQNLISYLKPEFELQCLNREDLKTALPNNNDVLIHLAGKAHDLKKTSQPDEYYQINYELTKTLYNAFLESDAKKFIFISSVKAAADEVEEVLFEDTLPNPQTHYGKSKLMAEEYIKNQPLPAGKSYYILRPCMIHGPGNKGNLNLLYNFVSKRFPYPLAGFKNKRSFLSIENLCFIIKQLVAQDNVPSGIYNAADDEALSTTEVVSLISSAINKRPKLLHVSTTFIQFIARVGDVLKLPLNTERLRKLTENYVVSNHKIKAALNKELPLTAREGIVVTIKAFKSL
jgi:nucleoside-diphosphate-sugar epimerase